MKVGAIVHVEMTSKDPNASRRFLEAVFGWEFEKLGVLPHQEYWAFGGNSGPSGGVTISGPTGDLTPAFGTGDPTTVNYVLVASVEATLKKIKANGGKILFDKHEIPGHGYFATYVIPGGVVQGIYES
jgi:predicted enzyme related to lactoylglutathione lyase